MIYPEEAKEEKVKVNVIIRRGYSMLIISLTHTRNQLQCILVAASVCFSFNCRGIQEKAITIQEDEEYESTLKLIKKIRKEK